MWLCICSIRQFEKMFENHLMEKFCISATLVTLHLFKQVIWKDTWKLTFEKTTHMQLMWLCICSIRRFEKTFENNNGEILHICNSCDFASVQAGDLRRHVKTNIWENHTHATNVTLHLVKWAIWEDVWKSFNREISHICGYCAFASVQAGDLRRCL